MGGGEGGCVAVGWVDVGVPYVAGGRVEYRFYCVMLTEAESIELVLLSWPYLHASAWGVPGEYCFEPVFQFLRPPHLFTSVGCRFKDEECVAHVCEPDVQEAAECVVDAEPGR